MRYLNRLKNADIYTDGAAALFSIIGIFMWAGTLTAYLWLYMILNDDDNTIASNFVLGIVMNHGAVLLLTVLDAVGPTGNSIVLQTFIIAHGSFNTFALGGILGGTLAGPVLEDAFYAAFVSLGLACFANAQMVASLFALFHRSIDLARGIDSRVLVRAPESKVAIIVPHDNTAVQSFYGPAATCHSAEVGNLSF